MKPPVLDGPLLASQEASNFLSCLILSSVVCLCGGVLLSFLTPLARYYHNLLFGLVAVAVRLVWALKCVCIIHCPSGETNVNHCQCKWVSGWVSK